MIAAHDTNGVLVRRKKILAADLFCGAGGFTTALMRELDAMGIDCELVAINHNPVAIATHSRNHPRARHEIQDLNNVDPEALVPEGYLHILLASPTCTFHSRARGGKPTSDQERMDPMVILTWCTKLRVQRLVIENVPEFVDWGPIDPRTGKPVKSRKGEYFRAWVAALEAIGYRVEWRIITAADHGDATTRERFFLMAKSDRKPLTWPEPTHTRDGVADLFGEKKKWRAAREIINWQDRGKSIFGRPVPLKPNTLRRIRAGAAKFSGPWADVFRAAVDQELYRSILYHEAGVGRILKVRPAQRRAKKGAAAARRSPRRLSPSGSTTRAGMHPFSRARAPRSPRTSPATLFRGSTIVGRRSASTTPPTAFGAPRRRSPRRRTTSSCCAGRAARARARCRSRRSPRAGRISPSPRRSSFR
jgi:site-specific DNA-cytosine methylase